MSDQPGSPEPRLTPADEERVRRLLAGSGPEPLPEDVADRLDETLASLLAERRQGRAVPEGADGDHDGSVSDQSVTHQADDRRIEVGPPRHRRRWPMVLGAAAAVCLIALGAGDLVRSGGSGGAASSSGQAASDAQAGSDIAGVPEAAAPGGARSGVLGALPPVPRLHTATLRADVARLARARHSLGAQAPSGPGALTCATPPYGPRDRVVLVRLDGRPAGLVLGPPAGGHRTARLYGCTDPGAALATVTVPAR